MTGRMVFEVGVQSQAFVVPLRDDEVAEETEQLALHLSTSSGRSTSALMSILDEDERSSLDPPSAATGASGAATASRAAPAPAGAAPIPQPQVRRRILVTAPRKRVALRQSPVTPFELRPASPESAGDVRGMGAGGPSNVDPLLALAAGLLVARVGAEVWFRSRTVSH
jgi:hypothetical protein